MQVSESSCVILYVYMCVTACREWATNTAFQVSKTFDSHTSLGACSRQVTVLCTCEHKMSYLMAEASWKRRIIGDLGTCDF
jgi:predicted metal-binding protein